MKNPEIPPGDYIMKYKFTKVEPDGTVKVIAEVKGQDGKLGGPHDGKVVMLSCPPGSDEWEQLG